MRRRLPRRDAAPRRRSRAPPTAATAPARYPARAAAPRQIRRGRAHLDRRRSAPPTPARYPADAPTSRRPPDPRRSVPPVTTRPSTMARRETRRDDARSHPIATLRRWAPRRGRRGAPSMRRHAGRVPSRPPRAASPGTVPRSTSVLRHDRPTLVRRSPPPSRAPDTERPVVRRASAPRQDFIGPRARGHPRTAAIIADARLSARFPGAPPSPPRPRAAACDPRPCRPCRRRCGASDSRDRSRRSPATPSPATARDRR